jgi:transcription elongation factor GreA
VVSDKIPMTRRGYDALKEELRRLKTSDRIQIVEDIRRAREHGDISENAEFEAAKERQAHIEGRIRILEDRLARADVVEIRGQTADRVRFGATVVLEDLDSGAQVTYALVGEDEADVGNGLLSVTSPVGRALIGKAVGDEVVVKVPSGTRQYEIHKIRFEDLA